MRTRRGTWVYSIAFTCIACIWTTVAAGNPRPHQSFDTTSEEGTGALPHPGGCVQAAIDQDMPGALAVVVLHGQSSSQRISFEIRNYTNDSISSVSIDGFDAMGGQGLFFSRVTTGGSARLEYPQNGVDGRGPIILDFGSFESGQCEKFEGEAGTWGEAGFRAGVMDMVGVRIQVVFEGGLRGSGEVLFCGSNGRFIRDVPCQPGDGIALISERRAMQVRLPR